MSGAGEAVVGSVSDTSARGAAAGLTVSDAVGTLNLSCERGNVLSATRVTSNGVTLATSYIYDAAGRISLIAYPSGWTIAYTRDAMGRVNAVSAQAGGGPMPATVVSNVTYPRAAGSRGGAVE
jgi:YD repeat-containing protein